MNSDIKIARSIKLQPIQKIAKQLKIKESDLELYGKYKSKLPLSLIKKGNIRKCKLVLVSAISPTPAGEGKTTMSIGLTQGLNQIGKKTTVVFEQSYGKESWI